MSDHCPTCGGPVRVVSADEGTSHYEPLGLDLDDPETVERLAEALIDSDLIRRYSEFTIDAHEFTAGEGFDVLAEQWTVLILAALRAKR